MCVSLVNKLQYFNQVKDLFVIKQKHQYLKQQKKLEKWRQTKLYSLAVLEDKVSRIVKI